MGLHELDGMDVPDNKGGRPSKDEQEKDTKRSAPGDGLTSAKDNEEWWQNKFDEFNNDNTEMTEVITDISREVQINTISVRLRLQELGIYETDWKEYIDAYPEYEKDMRLHRVVDVAPSPDSSSSSALSSSSNKSTLFDDLPSESTSDDDDDVSGGLSSMIDG